MKISTPQDLLRNPLNELLGSKANIRLLRVLSHDVGEPLNASDAARRAGLTAVGARKALAQLVRGGLVVRIGGGKSQQYALRADVRLLSALRVLFIEEQTRYDTFLGRLRELLASIPELRAAWIEKMPTELGQALEIVVVADTRALPWLRGELRTQVLPLEREFDQVIELETFTRVDAPNMGKHALSLLVGARPDEQGQALPPLVLHSERHERTLRLSRVVADLIRTDASLSKRALRHVRRLMQERQGTATADLLEWQQILEAYSPERIMELLVSTSSRATRLRQSSPFFAVLTPEERDILMKEYEDQR